MRHEVHERLLAVLRRIECTACAEARQTLQKPVENTRHLGFPDFWEQLGVVLGTFEPFLEGDDEGAPDKPE